MLLNPVTQTWTFVRRTEEVFVCAGLLVTDAFENIRLNGLTYLATYTTPCPIRSLRSLRTNERIEYKLTYKILTASQPLCLSVRNLLSIQHIAATILVYRYPFSTAHVFVITRMTDRSFRYASVCLWNRLPGSFRHLVPIMLLRIRLPSFSVSSPRSSATTPGCFSLQLTGFVKDC